MAVISREKKRKVSSWGGRALLNLLLWFSVQLLGSTRTSEHSVPSSARRLACPSHPCLLSSLLVLRTLMGHKANICSLDFHPYGEFVASGSQDTNIKVRLGPAPCLPAGPPGGSGLCVWPVEVASGHRGRVLPLSGGISSLQGRGCGNVRQTFPLRMPSFCE